MQTHIEANGCRSPTFLISGFGKGIWSNTRSVEAIITASTGRWVGLVVAR